MPLRVVIVEGSQPMRELLEETLGCKDDFAVVGTASDARQAVALASDLQPDLVIVDLLLPGIDGADLVHMLRDAAPAARVVVWTGMEPDAARPRVIEAGAHAFLVQTGDADSLVRGLEQAAS